MTTVRLYTGTPRSRRAAHIDVLMRAQWPQALLVTPTRFAANRRLEHLLLKGNLTGAWGAPVLSFEDFASSLLKAEGAQFHPVDKFERRLLVETVVRRLAEHGRLEALGEAATSGGFINHVLRVITQLKQAAVEPEEFQKAIGARQRKSWLDGIVAEVYEAYQKALIAARAYDRVGLYWHAAVIAREGKPTALDRVRSVILDGFDDFTPSEFRLLNMLAPHVDELVFGIAANVRNASQQDLYAIPLKTAQHIRKTFSVAEDLEFPEPNPRSFTEYLAREIFWRDKPQSPAGLQANVEIIPCPDLRQEVETVGRRIKTLLVDEGVPVDRIAVVFRDLSLVVPVASRVFQEFGIPVHFEVPPPLAQRSLAVFVLSLFDAWQTWSRGAVLDVVTAPWFMPGDEATRECIDLFPLLARQTGIIEGYDEWKNRVARLQERLDQGTGEDVERLVRRAPHAGAAASALLQRLVRLHELEQQVPTKGKPSAFIEAVEECLQRCGALDALSAMSEKPCGTLEHDAWNALIRVLGRIDAWYRRDAETSPVTRDDFVRLLASAFNETGVPEPASDCGIRCLNAESVRDKDFDYVFLCGMNEGDFPRPPAVGAIYTEGDLVDLAEQGVLLDDKGRHANREMLLFHQVIAAAQRHLCVSWHVQSRDQRQASPSPFLVDTLELFSEQAVHGVPDSPAFAPSVAHVASRRDVRNTAFAHSTALRQAYAKEFAFIETALSVETARQDASPFGVYDGVLMNKSLKKDVAEAFGSDHDFSVNQLEAYAQCPFQFFLQRLLNVGPEDDPGTEFDPLVRGRILHEVLQAFHTEFVGRPAKDIPTKDAEHAMARHLDRVFDGRARRSINTPPGMMEVERARMAMLLQRYLVLAQANDKEDWQPSHFEVSFGNAHGASPDALSRPDPYVMTTPTGEVRFSGRIDRVDTQGTKTRIVDYKTSIAIRKRDVEEGVALQLPLYTLALEEFLMPGSQCREAILMQVGKKKTLNAIPTQEEKCDAQRQFIREKVAEYVAAIRAGIFPPTPYNDLCHICKTNRACRYDAGRVARKRETRM